jgi:hypothetical protein
MRTLAVHKPLSVPVVIEVLVIRDVRVLSHPSRCPLSEEP